MDKGIIKQILLDQRESFISQEQGSLRREKLGEVSSLVDLPHIVVITGHRRSGKSVFLSQIFRHYYQHQGYYLNFEDERLYGLSVSGMQKVMELFEELFGYRKVIFLDEVQNLVGWEKFVSRLYREGYKIYITGSNAYLLSSELSSLLTGRHLDLEIFPFSFREFLAYRGLVIKEWKDCYKRDIRTKIKSALEDYIAIGGFPEMVKYKRTEILSSLFSDVVTKDVLGRFNIKHYKQMRDLAAFLISNVAREISYNKIKNTYAFGSVHTVKEYMEHLCSAYLFFEVSKFSFSLREQQIRSKKIYAIDTGMVRSVKFSLSRDEGWLYENAIFLQLRRKLTSIFFYKSRGEREVDFVYREKDGGFRCMQVSIDCLNEKVLRRELLGLWNGVKELGLKEGLILCMDEEAERRFRDITVRFVPIWRFLLFGE